MRNLQVASEVLWKYPKAIFDTLLGRSNGKCMGIVASIAFVRNSMRMVLTRYCNHCL